MFIDTNQLPVIERLPGWKGRYFDSPSMTFGHYEFEAGATIHEHSHEQEEIWEIIEGELQITVDGVTQVSGPGSAGIIPAHSLHSVRAMSDGKAIVVDYPQRRMVTPQTPR
jgi:quercetin dioxygenase-like cupin family protein